MIEYVEIKKVLALLNDLVNDCVDKDEFYNRAFDSIDDMPTVDIVTALNNDDALIRFLEQYKTAIAKNIFEDIENLKHTKFDWSDVVDWDGIAELKKKYVMEEM